MFTKFCILQLLILFIFIEELVMIDNYELIKPLLRFENPDHFYFLQLLRRKKENTTMTANSDVVKNYYISNLEYLDYKYQEIKDLCNFFNARAMLRLNRRSYEKTAFKTLKNISDSIYSKQYRGVCKDFDSACGTTPEDPDKTWIIDIDEQISISDQLQLRRFIELECEPFDDIKYRATIPTKNGLHIITRPFNLQKFNNKYGSVYSIHKDNPTNLYIPGE